MQLFAYICRDLWIIGSLLFMTSTLQNTMTKNKKEGPQLRVKLHKRESKWWLCYLVWHDWQSFQITQKIAFIVQSGVHWPLWPVGQALQEVNWIEGPIPETRNREFNYRERQKGRWTTSNYLPCWCRHASRLVVCRHFVCYY